MHERFFFFSSRFNHHCHCFFDPQPLEAQYRHHDTSTHRAPTLAWTIAVHKETMLLFERSHRRVPRTPEATSHTFSFIHGPPQQDSSSKYPLTRLENQASHPSTVQVHSNV